MIRIAAVVVTYNRIKLLQKVIDSLRKQTRPLDEIIVINNSSTDGTSEWLAQQTNLTVYEQPNVGGSGGFYRGIKEAYEAGYDWIWCMDDDVFPEPEALATLLLEARPEVGILVPRRFISGVPYISEVRKLNFSNPFTRLHKVRLRDCETVDSVTEIEGMTFEGPLIRRELIRKIGLPNKDLFILFDDTDYSYRAVLAGYKVLSVPQAKLNKYDFSKVQTVQESFETKKWKKKYDFRNNCYISHHYGKNFFFRYFRPFPRLIARTFIVIFNLLWNKRYSFHEIPQLFLLYKQGMKEELSKID